LLFLDWLQRLFYQLLLDQLLNSNAYWVLNFHRAHILVVNLLEYLIQGFLLDNLFNLPFSPTESKFLIIALKEFP
jgi:hypothetical protein